MSQVKYGTSVAYRHMCRWFSGLFVMHPLLSGYEFYWRVEPGVDFYCKINYDVFQWMEDNNKSYGFVISLLELPKTVTSLWPITREYLKQRRITNSTLLNFFLNDYGNYNLCHFWSNFEIARFSIWRDPAYLDYFTYLDRWDGFYLERWGDAPVHSLWVGIRLNKSQVHFFHDIGYRHDTISRCVNDGSRCKCPKSAINFDFHKDSCLARWLEYK
ncbi:hypothetical protein SmJEL517_g03607 [Synchytrium microbalum]|uniref:Uncharacterized protein n=1 Tax=Synchytrium microbalum TaxID=1806994 RepID=A0A507C1E6_9FUNG|nr:uncharacterized protein SmJEL517_g03607 [Synchytrium microbalum]TPX33522.1 hypothetical protein SmJEL517_g03607 [Synchytrium microbalum]